jgi:hypothetical protein
MRNKAKSFCQSLGMQLAALESAQKIRDISDSIEKGAATFLIIFNHRLKTKIIFSRRPQYFVVVRDQQRPCVRRVPVGGRGRRGGRRFVGAQRAQNVRAGGQGVRGHDARRPTGRLRLRHQEQTALPTASRSRPMLFLIIHHANYFQLNMRS